MISTFMGVSREKEKGHENRRCKSGRASEQAERISRDVGRKYVCVCGDTGYLTWLASAVFLYPEACVALRLVPVVQVHRVCIDDGLSITTVAWIMKPNRPEPNQKTHCTGTSNCKHRRSVQW